MDRLSAHLDRGWDLAQHGDVRGAEAAAKKALEVDPDAPEVHNLLGYVAALAGEPEEAVEHYRQALALDEGYFDAMLNAAEVLCFPLGEYEEAIEMCDEAISWAETDEEKADALLVKIDALLAVRDDDGVRKALGSVPSSVIDAGAPARARERVEAQEREETEKVAGKEERDPVRFLFAVGRAWFELGEHERAHELLERALTADGLHPEANYYAALTLELRGEQAEAVEHFLRVRKLDERAPMVPWSLSEASFFAAMERAIRTLDPALRRFVEHAHVWVVELPGYEVICDGIDPRAPLLLDGIATPEHPGPPCARVFAYQRNIERPLASATELHDELVRLLEQEITATFLEGREGQRPRSKHELN